MKKASLLTLCLVCFFSLASAHAQTLSLVYALTWRTDSEGDYSFSVSKGGYATSGEVKTDAAYKRSRCITAVAESCVFGSVPTGARRMRRCCPASSALKTLGADRRSDGRRILLPALRWKR